MARVLLAALLFAAALSAQSPLVTTFAHNSTSLLNGAVYFDLDVTASAITIHRLDLNLQGSGVVEIWTKPGSRAGHQLSPPPWSLRGVGVVTSAVAGLPAIVQVPPFVLQEGLHGMAIRGVGLSQLYTIGNGGNQHYANAHVALDAGEAAMGLFVGPLLSPRVVNAAIHYLVGEAISVPSHSTTTTGGSRGYRFTALADFNLRELALPPQAFAPGCTASYVVRINDAVVYRSTGNAGAVPLSLHVATGDVVDVLGNWSPSPAGQASARVSAANGPVHIANIGGLPHPLNAVGWTWDVGDPAWVANGPTGTFMPAPPLLGRVLLTTEPGSQHGSTTGLGVGCGLVAGSCHETFASGASFDLAQSALTFTPQPGGGYAVTRTGTLLPVGSTGVVVPLALGDDAEVSVPLVVGSFPGWSALTICSNGFVSSATGNGTGAVPAASTMIGAPRTAFWSWHDFDPSLAGSGQVKVEQSPAVTAVTWDGVWSGNGTNASAANTLQFQLRADGRVTIVWGAMSATGGAHVVGYSPGGLSPLPAATDFSALGTGTLSLAATEAWPLILGGNVGPTVGSSWDLLIFGIPPTAVLGVDVLGLSDPGIDDLAAIGMPGCGLRASLDVIVPWFPSGISRWRSFHVPNNVSLVNLSVYATSAVFTVPALNAFGAITTNGMKGRIGDL